MTFDLIGKNAKTRINLGYTQASALAAVLAELLGKEAEFLGPSTQSDCKVWADALRNNIYRLRLIKGVNKKTGHKYAFLVVQGTDIKRMFSSEHYKHDIIDFKPSWEMAKELDDEWKIVVNDFIEFLDSCEGIVKVV